MSWNRPTLIVILGSLATLAMATAPAPLWDEDEARFAAIARTMVETGDWVVPTFNGTLAVDKPVLMHWCIGRAGGGLMTRPAWWQPWPTSAASWSRSRRMPRHLMPSSRRSPPGPR